MQISRLHTRFPAKYRVPYDGSFLVSSALSSPDSDVSDDGKLKKRLRKANQKLYDLQRVLYAHNKYSLLLIFQAMDAAGKDSTIRTVLRGVNPAGCQVFSFKQPSSEELEHDFLWRSARRLPEKGRIGVFNRSYYEEVIVVRVHPEYLTRQNIAGEINTEQFWSDRFDSICDHEKHLATSNTIVIKFWLNVSRHEQKNRFIQRLDNPEKNWKFSAKDVEERKHWDHYMACYESLLNETSKPHAPWYAIPADNKPYMRLQVATTIIETLESLDIHYPEPSQKNVAQFQDLREKLESE